MTRLQLLLSATATLVLLTLSSACEESMNTPRCGALEDPHGCPVSRGGSCSDRSCSALYRCDEAGWTLVETCNNTLPDPGAKPDAGSEEPPVTCASDAEAPGTSCPSLSLPDCDAALLDGCLSDIACMSGCEVFLRCKDGDWAASYAAYCDEDGNLIRPE